ncbi:unnamed protein product [Nesidiocoris tenuis]|uniref:Uncharacterized protein n=1 Tax=Nesidiocoris tenuis TaxID=355587 RepID=A0A6H5HQD8_9HEMI|nr:unnamed protein product [Nesidiocoris tenuis]
MCCELCGRDSEGANAGFAWSAIGLSFLTSPSFGCRFETAGLDFELFALFLIRNRHRVTRLTNFSESALPSRTLHLLSCWSPWN